MAGKIQHYIIILLIIFFLSGCTSVQYYSQSIRGQFEVLNKSRKISDKLNEPDIPNSLRNKLNTVLQLRQFSIEQLELPRNNSYTTYADLERNYVIWNIFASDELSLEPLTWCYLIIGCLSYRGYFSKAEAILHSTKLEQQGYDVYLGGVTAYSTLGWFDDPVLNTMIRWSDSYLATVMFHELAHQQLYIRNDTEFNESYADAVAHIGVTKWLEQKQDKTELKKYRQSQIHEKLFVALVMRYRTLLNNLYQSNENVSTKRKYKKKLLERMRSEYFEMAKKWGVSPYKNWFSSDINNAKLGSVVTYREYVPAFLEIYEKLNKNLSLFYSFGKSLTNCNPMKRKEILKARKIEFEC